MATALLKLTDVQLGTSVTATNNFTIYQPASPDGTVRIGNGNSGSATDIMTLNSSGNVGIGTSSPTDSTSFGRALDVSSGTGATVYVRNSAVSSYYGYLGYYSNSLFVYNNSSAGPILFGTNNATKMTLDSSGNLGLGVTPSAWYSDYRALEILGYGTGLAADNYNVYTELLNNAYGSARSTFTYKSSFGATRYSQQRGAHAWYTAPSGTAGNAISFTQAMTLDASGNLMVGTTTIGSGNRMNVVGNNVTFSPNTAGKETFVFTTGAADKGVFYIKNDTTNTVKLDTNGDSYLNGGNVGIGTSSPDSRLFVRCTTTGSTAHGIGMDAGAQQHFWYLSDNTTSTFQVNSGAGVFRWVPNGSTEAMRIDSSGNLLVGKTSAAAQSVGFEARPTGEVNSAATASTNGSATTWNTYSTGAAAYRFYVGMGGTVYATSTTISAISDRRYKENIRDLDAGLNEVLALKPRVFDWKEGKGKDIKNDRGFIAQEFEQVFPDLIDEWKDPAPEGEEPYKSVRQDLIPVLVKAIQEQQAIIESLTKRIETLEGA